MFFFLFFISSFSLHPPYRAPTNFPHPSNLTRTRKILSANGQFAKKNNDSLPKHPHLHSYPLSRFHLQGYVCILSCSTIPCPSILIVSGHIYFLSPAVDSNERVQDFAAERLETRSRCSYLRQIIRGLKRACLDFPFTTTSNLPPSE